MRLANTPIKNMETCRAFIHWKMYLSLYAAKGNRTKTFLHGRRNALWILNLKHSLDRLSHHLNFVSHLLQAEGRILFVECPLGLEDYWERLASLYGHDYVDGDTWLHGSINAHFSARSHTYSLVVLHNADPDLGILEECLKADIPLVQFADIRQESLGVDYWVPYAFSENPQAYWYLEAWRSLLSRKKKKKRWPRPAIDFFFQWKTGIKKPKRRSLKKNLGLRPTGAKRTRARPSKKLFSRTRLK